MYCVKCGKLTVGNDNLCPDCRAAENAAGFVQPAVVPDPPKSNVSMLSFGKALASTIMGFGVFIISSVLNGSGSYMNLISMIFMIIIDIAAIVLSIVFGAKAIHTYSTFKAGAGKRPLPAFILGIIGVVLAGIATVIVIVFLFVDLPQIAAYL